MNKQTNQPQILGCAAAHTRELSNARRQAAFKTNDSGTQFTVAIYLNRLDRNMQSHQAALFLREIADRLDRAEFTVMRAPATSIGFAGLAVNANE